MDEGRIGHEGYSMDSQSDTGSIRTRHEGSDGYNNISDFHLQSQQSSQDSENDETAFHAMMISAESHNNGNSHGSIDSQESYDFDEEMEENDPEVMLIEAETYLEYSRTPEGIGMICSLQDDNETPSVIFLKLLQYINIELVDKQISNLIQSTARRTIFNLTSEASNRMFIVEHGALPHIITACRTKDIVSVACLGNLAYEETTKRTIVNNFDGVDLFVQLLSEISLESIPVLIHAARGLFSISTVSEFKTAIVDNGGFDALIRCLQFAEDAIMNSVEFDIAQMEQMQINAVGALANLAIHKENKYKMITKGILKHLLQISRISDSHLINYQIIRCLFSLTADKRNRSIMLGMLNDQFIYESVDSNIENINCLPFILRMVRSSHEELRLNAVGAIGNIAMTDSLRLILHENGVVGLLLGIVNSNQAEKDLLRHVIRALYTLSSKDEVRLVIVQDQQERNNISDKIHKIIIAFPSEVELKRDALGLLANICFCGTGISEAIVKSDIIDYVIADCLKTHIKGILSFDSILSPSTSSSTIEAATEDLVRQCVRLLFNLTKFSHLAIKKVVDNGEILPLIVQVIDILNASYLSNINIEFLNNAIGIVTNIATTHPGDIVCLDFVQIGFKLMTNCKSSEPIKHMIAALTMIVKGSMMESVISRTQVKYLGCDGEMKRSKDEMRTLYERAVELSKTFTSSMQGNADMGLISNISEIDKSCVCLKVTLKEKAPFVILIHECIFASRMKELGSLSLKLSSPSSIPCDDKEMQCFGKRYIIDGDSYPDLSNVLVWYALLEYMYANDIQASSSNISKDMDLSLSLMMIAQQLGQYKLFLLCQEINADAKKAYNQKMGVVDANRCMSNQADDFWIRDMENLLYQSNCADLYLEISGTSLTNSPSSRKTRESETDITILEQDVIKCCDENSAYKDESSSASISNSYIQSQSRRVKKSRRYAKLDNRIYQEESMDQISEAISRSESIIPCTPKKKIIGSRVNDSSKLYSPFTLAVTISKSLIIQRNTSSNMIRCHKPIIVSRCPFLSKALNWKETMSSIQKDKDEMIKIFAPTEVATIVARYIYCGLEEHIVKILREDPGINFKVMSLSNELLLEGLVHHCQMYLSTFVEIDNVFDILREAEVTTFPFLFLFCVHHLAQEIRFGSIKESLIHEGLKSLPVSTKNVAEGLLSKWGLLERRGSHSSKREQEEEEI